MGDDDPKSPDIPDIRSTIEAAVESQTQSGADGSPPIAPDAAQPAQPPEPSSAPGPARDEQGRFARAEAGVTPPVTPASAQTPPPPAGSPAAPAQPDAPVQRVAPVRWSVAEKAAYAKADPILQDAIAKREVEMANGAAKYAEYKPLDPYLDMARNAGVSLSDTLKIYTDIDTAMGKDVVTGLGMIMDNIGIDARTVCAEWARRLGMLGNGGVQPAPPPQPGPGSSPAVDPRLDQLIPIVSDIASQFHSTRLKQVEDDITAFWADPKNPYAENVAPLMAQLMEEAKRHGKVLTLREAYDQAVWQNPEIRELLINERLTSTAGSIPGGRTAVASKARAAAKAVTGAPTGGTPPAAASSEKLSLRDTIVAAVEQSGGRA
jgi:hypothetical protein